MREEKSCTVACKYTLDAQAAKDFKEKIDDEYRVNMYVLYEFVLLPFSLLGINFTL